MTFDEEGNGIDEAPVGNAADLPAAEGYEETTDEQGSTTRTVTDESSTLLSLQLGPDGSVLDLQLPPSTETMETVEASSYESRPGPQQQAEEGAQEATGQAQEAVGQVRDQARQTMEGVQDAAGQATDQAQEAAGQAAGQVQDAAGQATDQQGGGEQEELKATNAARRRAEELGLDLSQVEGTGAQGQIIISDVNSAANQSGWRSRERQRIKQPTLALHRAGGVPVPRRYGRGGDLGQGYRGPPDVSVC